MDYPTKSAEARAICIPRWAGVTEPIKRDPCDGCQLYAPCVKASPVAPGREALVRWIDGINTAAAQVSSCRGNDAVSTGLATGRGLSSEG